MAYEIVDQGRPEDIDALFRRRSGPFDVVIGDGSHQPEHQRNCLLAGLPHVRPGGRYLLEDLHTSHPKRPAMRRRDRRRSNCLDLLLMFEHLLATGTELTEPVLAEFVARSMFTADEVCLLWQLTSAVEFHVRPDLPLSCWRCGSSSFRYAAGTCACGEPVNSWPDSMAAVVTRH